MFCIAGQYSERVSGIEPPPPEKFTQKFLGPPYCGIAMTVDIIHAILSGFSAEMILIAQTVIFMIFY